MEGKKWICRGIYRGSIEGYEKISQARERYGIYKA